MGVFKKLSRKALKSRVFSKTIMEVKIEKKTENTLLGRTEIEGSLTFTGPTPSYKDLTTSLSTSLKVAPEVVLIRHVYTSFGIQTAKFDALVYESKEKLENVEGNRVKKKAAQEKPAEAAAA